MCMAKNGKGAKHTRRIASRIHFVIDNENFKTHKIEWCEVGIQLADIDTKNVDDNYLTPRMKYIMLRLDN